MTSEITKVSGLKRRLGKSSKSESHDADTNRKT